MIILSQISDGGNPIDRNISVSNEHNPFLKFEQFHSRKISQNFLVANCLASIVPSGIQRKRYCAGETDRLCRIWRLCASGMHSDATWRCWKGKELVWCRMGYSAWTRFVVIRSTLLSAGTKYSVLTVVERTSTLKTTTLITANRNMQFQIVRLQWSGWTIKFRTRFTRQSYVCESFDSKQRNHISVQRRRRWTNIYTRRTQWNVYNCRCILIYGKLQRWSAGNFYTRFILHRLDWKCCVTVMN